MLQKILSFLGQLLGHVQWSKPLWLSRRLDRAKPNLQRSSAHIRRHKKRYTQGLAITTLVAVAALVGLKFYQGLPKANVITFSVDAPQPMSLYAGAKPNPLVVRFSAPAALLDLIQKPIGTDFISISPKVEGAWIFRSDQVLEFNPKSEWMVGTEFQVEMSKKLFAAHVQLDARDFEFKTVEFSVGQGAAEFYQNPTQARDKKVVATFYFSHPVDPDTFAKNVSVDFGSEHLKFTILYGPNFDYATVHSEAIKIPADDSAAVITLAGGVRSLRGGAGTKDKKIVSIKVPGMFNFFKIRSASPTLVRNEKYEPEQVLVIESTAEAKTTDIAKGLEVLLLPFEDPAQPLKKKRTKPAPWVSVGQLTPEVLKASEKIQLEVIPSELENSLQHTFRFKAPVHRSLYIKINKGLKAFGDYVLANDFEQVALVSDYPRELMLMHKGSLLSLSGDKKIAILARNIPAVRFELARLMPSAINHLVTQSQGSFEQPDFNYNFDKYEISERFEEIQNLAIENEAATQYTSFDFSKYLRAEGLNRGMFVLTVEAWDPVAKAPLASGRYKENRFVMITDLGLLAKDSLDGTRHLYVQSLSTGAPVSGANVEVLGLNGVTVLSKSTGADGHVEFPDLKNFQYEKRPLAYVVRKSSDISYLPFNKADRRLDLSKFDVGGVYASGSEDRLVGYLFSDRGIYRPGDEMRLGAIVRSMSWGKSVAGVPLEYTISDSKGSEVQKDRMRLGALGFEDIRFALDENAPTGSYDIRLYIVKDNRRDSLIGSTSVRVEEFLPDRMKISTHISQQKVEGWIKPKDLSATVSLKNLFGTPAQDRRVVTQLKLTPSFPVNRLYKDYVFLDPKRTDKNFKEMLEEMHTNSTGEVVVPIDLSRFENATYRMTVLANGYEAEGGRSVSSEASVLVSPLDYVLGYKGDGDLRYMRQGVARSIEVIALNADLKKIGVQDLKSQLIEIKYLSVLTKQNNGTFKYQSVLKELPFEDPKEFIVKDLGTKISVKTTVAGDFAWVVKNSEGAEVLRVPYSIMGGSNLKRGLDKNAELQVALNKADYDPGEEIEMQIRAPYAGSGLITIERDGVFAHQWFKSDSETTMQKIRIPPGIEGNAYVQVSFVRSLASKEIYTNPLSYGVAPFSLNRSGRTNSIKLTAPERVKPGDKVRIKYSSARPGKAIVFAVDEGILQVANYKVPDPLEFFFKKRALQVSTYQILDLLMPEYSVAKSAGAVGGDEGASGANENLNPFKRKRDKPMAYWSGVVDLSAQTKEVVVDVPDSFNGSLRVMAVAVAADSVGVAREDTLVRGDLIVSPNTPSFASPGDAFEASVSVSNNIEGSQNAQGIVLKVEATDHFEIVGDKETKLDIKEGSEASAHFKVKVKDRLGAGTLKFVATHAGKSGQYRSEMSIRPLMPFEVDLQMGVHNDAAPLTLNLKHSFYDEYRDVTLAGSLLPLGMGHGLAKFLDKYPYGCTEQLVSKSFPALVMAQRPEFGMSPDRAKSSLSALTRVLRTRQTSEGGFALWPGGATDNWVTVYALHYLTEAKAMGFIQAQDLLDRGLELLKSSPVYAEADRLESARLSTYAHYVIVRNGGVPTQSLSGLRKKMDANLSKQWPTDLSGAYLASVYKLLKRDDEALRLIGAVKFGAKVTPNYASYYDGAVQDGQLLSLLAKHFPERVKRLDAGVFISLARQLTNGLNSINASYALLGFSGYADAIDTLGGATKDALSLSEILGSKGPSSLNLSDSKFPVGVVSTSATAAQVEKKGALPIFYQLSESGFDRKLPDKAVSQGIEVVRDFIDQNGKKLDALAMGDEAIARLRLRSTGAGSYQQIVLVDLLPSGLEAVLEPVIAAEQWTPPPEFEGEGGGGGEGESEGAWMRRLKPLRLDEILLGSKAFAQSSKDAHFLSVPTSTLTVLHAELREDRVLVYTMASPSAGDYYYKVKAIQKGSFTVPPPYGTSMYDRSIKALGLAARFEVTPAQ